MSSTEPKVASYLEFAETVLPRVAALGYNTIQVSKAAQSAILCKVSSSFNSGRKTSKRRVHLHQSEHLCKL